MISSSATSLPHSNPTSSSTSSTSNTSSTTLVVLLLVGTLLSVCGALLLDSPYCWDLATYLRQAQLAMGEGVRDYSRLRGATGPVAYPALHILAYALLLPALLPPDSHDPYHPALRLGFAHFVFAVLLVLTVLVLTTLYRRSSKVPFWIVLLFLSSRRVLNIYVLGFFNDAIAMPLLYFAIFLFVHRRWSWGCFVFSLAVGVKMSVLLFAPGLLLLLVLTGDLRSVLKNLTICGATQLLIGLPFLLENPWAYVRLSFNFGRRFMHSQTINYRFLSEDLFHSPLFAAFLLLVHLALLFFFLRRHWQPYWNQIFLANGPQVCICDDQIFTILFISNLIGVTMARSLHYQFFVWYFHQLPYLLWRTDMKNWQRIGVFALLTWAWEVHPSSVLSSLCLHLGHLLLLFGLYRNTSLLSLTNASESASTLGSTSCASSFALPPLSKSSALID